jgi:proteasome lid subunit RPN8/RPN11
MDGRRLHIPLLLWWRLHRQLRRRSAGLRESGAFLLGRREVTGIDKVRRFVCYDDLDPTCLARGYVEFHSTGFAKLWKECRRLKLDVLADVHTHPGPDASQSEVDRTHPMVSEPGHVAVILPNYSRHWAFRFKTTSVYEYEGNYRWRDWSGDCRPNRLRFTCW